MAAGAACAGGPPGDVNAGEGIYERCAACHSLRYDRTGPRHCGLFGRRAGTVKGYPYSDAMKRSGIVWNDGSLDRFLAAPLTAVPGTSMGYAGVEDATERGNLIAFLKRANEAPGCR
jgi:cytochrome c